MLSFIYYNSFVYIYHKFNKQCWLNYSSTIPFTKKYAPKKSFWSDFPDDRPCNNEDHLQFLLPVASKIRKLEIIAEEEKRNIFRRLKALWDVNLEAEGEKASPRDVVISLFNFSLIKMYEAGDEANDWLNALDTIYDVYFTKERIDNFNKFRIIK